MRLLLRFAMVLAASSVAVTSACWHSKQAAAPKAHKVRGTGPITQKELTPFAGWDTYQAIKLLRPQFLQNRGATSIELDSPSQPEVAIDGIMYGRLESLAQLPVSEVETITLLNVGDAVIKYGPGHPAGVIDIVTKH
ncbi:MAG TPA: hypothetical protein VN677_08095 [Gemmatimonadaceae bacterium]|jgi:hypothetical protein|nr:hypothetical protein [Gemmatimonadaceae bacterium]